MLGIDEIMRTAALAKLYVSPEEAARLASEMSVIVDFANRVSAFDVPDEEDAPRPGSLREDEVIPSLPAESLLAEAPRTEDGFYTVRSKFVGN